MPAEPCALGIDGGGSTVRAVLVTADLTPVSEGRAATANPVAVGPDTAAHNIQTAIRAALEAAACPPQQVRAVGIGVAGAAAAALQPWLRATVQAVVPDAALALSTDYAIALVGANGAPEGLLVLAGTGSLAYGALPGGESALVGGWGYVLGDEGSGFWIGVQGLRAAAWAAEGRGPQTALSARLLAALDSTQAREMIAWVYDAPGTARRVATLAPLVLATATAGDPVAAQIVADAVAHLTLLAHTVQTRLGMVEPRIAFAGGLLSAPNPLSDGLCAALGLDALPVPRYSPAQGAALLGLLAAGR